MGLGNGVSASTGLTDITYDELLDLIEAQGMNSADYGVILNQNEGYCGTYYLTIDHNDGSNPEKIDIGDKNEPNYGLTIRQLLDRDTDYTMSIYASKGEQLPIVGAELIQNHIGGNDTSDGILDWMYHHNDFAAETYRYTEVINGHQKCVGE
jgi:hypothetical protein